MIAIGDQHWTGFTDSLRRPSASSGAAIDNPSYPYKDDESYSDVGRKRRPQIHDAGGGGGRGGLPVPNRNAGGKLSARKDARLGVGAGGRLSASSGSTIVASKNMGQGKTKLCWRCSSFWNL